MLAALVLLAVLPYINTSEVRSTTFRPIFRQFYWLFIADCLILGWIGGKVAEYPYVQIGQVATAYYFGFILVLVPVIGRVESFLMRRAQALA